VPPSPARQRPSRRTARPAGAAQAADRPYAVVDIGSNSVRLVVFEGARRATVTLYNEKVTCELGRGLDDGGRLDPGNVARAIAAITRFVAIARGAGAGAIDLIATAAVRDATDSEAFATAVRKAVGVSVRVLRGAEEARLAALGVVSGIPGADGIVGDLGGGSLELVDVATGALGQHDTRPVGPLRLMALGGTASSAAAREAVDRELGALTWLAAGRGRPIFAVGGAWRALARLQMAQAEYPLRVLHNYRLNTAKADDLCALVTRMGRQSLRRIGTVSRNRLAALPWAALVLQRLLVATGAGAVVFSANGLREGALFDRLSAAERRRDPLLAACADAVRDQERIGPHGEALRRFLASTFPGEPARLARLRHATALLSDVAWREHPEYRADMALQTALHMPYGCLAHDERAWIALGLHARYGGVADAPETKLPRRLLDEADAAQARTTGLALRLGFALSGASPRVLGQAALTRDGPRLVLHVGPRLAPMLGELVERRLRAVAEAVGAEPVIVTATTPPHPA
jgi:exopolyphosphatase/guanosine-5'-triphosphate,3'-diphosphate pyrophosphatase